MRVANPKPSGTRLSTAPTRDEVDIGLGLPTVVGAPKFGLRTYAPPLGPGPPKAGLNDSPNAQRGRQDQ